MDMCAIKMYYIIIIIIIIIMSAKRPLLHSSFLPYPRNDKSYLCISLAKCQYRPTNAVFIKRPFIILLFSHTLATTKVIFASLVLTASIAQRMHNVC
jgi:hypothetical protein